MCLRHIGEADRDEAQRHAQETAVRTSQAGHESQEGRAHELMSAEMKPCAQRGQEEQRLRVRGAEKQRERICGDEEHGHPRAFRREEIARDRGEVPRGADKGHQCDEESRPCESGDATFSRDAVSVSPGYHTDCLHRHRERGEEREVLLAIEAALPLVALRGNSCVPVGVEPRRQFTKDGPRTRRRCPGNQAKGRHGKKPNHQDNGPRQQERQQRVSQRRTFGDVREPRAPRRGAVGRRACGMTNDGQRNCRKEQVGPANRERGVAGDGAKWTEDEQREGRGGSAGDRAIDHLHRHRHGGAWCVRLHRIS